jgi:hypothetical protein
VTARRFGLVFQFATPRGTAEQETTIRAAVDRHVLASPPFGKVLLRLARQVKLWQHFIPIVFNKDMGADGWTFPYLMMLNADLPPAAYLEYVFLHETGHLIGRHLISPVDRTCSFADGFAIWVESGCPDPSPIPEE